MISQYNPRMAFEYVVGPDGQLAWAVPVDSFSSEKIQIPVAGLTLAEAQEALQKVSVRKVPAGPGGGLAGAATGKEPVESIPICLTLGGWREEADPEVVEQFEGNDVSRIQRLESDIRELKDMVRKLKGERN